MAKGNTYLQKISEDLEDNPSNIIKKLKILERKGYLISKIEGNKKVFPFERKVYAIPSKKLVKDFIDYFMKKRRNELNSIFMAKSEKKHLLEILNKLEADFRSLEKNPIFSQMMWSIISHHAYSDEIDLLKTSFDYFDMTIYSMLDPRIGVVGNIKEGVEVSKFHERVKAYEDEKNKIVTETKKHLNSREVMKFYNDFNLNATKSTDNTNKMGRNMH
jgi:predicted transcriptional regulator